MSEKSSPFVVLGFQPRTIKVLATPERLLSFILTISTWILNTRYRMETKILEDTIETVSPSSKGASFWVGIILLITAGVLATSGIVLYNNAQNKITAKKNATRVTVEVTPTTAPVSLTTQYENPFEEKTQYENPFSQEQNQSENPFDALVE